MHGTDRGGATPKRGTQILLGRILVLCFLVSESIVHCLVPGKRDIEIVSQECARNRDKET